MNIHICIGTREIHGRGFGDIGAIYWLNKMALQRNVNVPIRLQNYGLRNYHMTSVVTNIHICITNKREILLKRSSCCPCDRRGCKSNLNASLLQPTSQLFETCERARSVCDSTVSFENLKAEHF